MARSKNGFLNLLKRLEAWLAEMENRGLQHISGNEQEGLTALTWTSHELQEAQDAGVIEVDNNRPSITTRGQSLLEAD